MKCYYYEYSNGVKEFHYAETRNEARKYFADNLALPYIDVKVYRAEWADQYDELSLKPKIRLEHGESVYCWGCNDIIDPDDVYYVDDKGRCRCRKCNMVNKVKGFFGRGE